MRCYSIQVHVPRRKLNRICSILHLFLPPYNVKHLSLAKAVEDITVGIKSWESYCCVWKYTDCATHLLLFSGSSSPNCDYIGNKKLLVFVECVHSQQINHKYFKIRTTT